MGSGMMENMDSCTWLGSMERGPPEGRRVYVAAVVRLWSRKSLGGGDGIPRHGYDQDLPEWKPPPPWLRTN